MDDQSPWMIMQERASVYGRFPASVWTDRRQHLLVFEYQATKNGTLSSSSTLTLNISDISSISSKCSGPTVDTFNIINLERIHYIQRGGNLTTRRSARNYSQTNKSELSEQNNDRIIEIFYSTEEPRSEYLYRSISFQLKKTGNELEKWMNALYVVIDEAKTINETGRRNRWLLREYEKLRNSSKGLTVDSINGWLNSHLGIVGERKQIQDIITDKQQSYETSEITDSIFKKIYSKFYNNQQTTLMQTLMSDLIERETINLRNLILRIGNNREDLIDEESRNIRNFLKIDQNGNEIPLLACANYLWSDGNSVFNPFVRTTVTDDMNQPLNHYWISSSHNTYLAKTQIFNPASHHCYIQALLQGCRCIEIDVVDGRFGPEPEVTHRNTRVKPIPLREVLESIHDYAFVTSEYPLIISIENHCSSEQRSIMAKMFIEIFGDYLLRSPLDPNEKHLPSPFQLKRKILLKDSKVNNPSVVGTQINPEPEDVPGVPSPGIDGRLQFYDCNKQKWFWYKYSLMVDDLFLEKDGEVQTEKFPDDDFTDEEDNIDQNQEVNEIVQNLKLTQVWFHGNISHQVARSLILSNAAHEIGTFLVRESSNKLCYCITFLAMNSEVKSIEVHESEDSAGKRFYSISQIQFESIPDLICHYRTYDFAEIFNETKRTLYRLGRPLPRPTYKQELERQPWYQPKLSRKQAIELLQNIGEEMTFLIRESFKPPNHDYSLSVFVYDTIRHLPIYRDGEDLMLMSKSFTGLVELVEYFSQNPIFDSLTLQKAAKSYDEFLNAGRRTEQEEKNKDRMFQQSLDNILTFKVSTLTITKIDKDQNDKTFQAKLVVQEEQEQSKDKHLLLKFEDLKDLEAFLLLFKQRITPNRPQQDTLPSITYPEKSQIKSNVPLQSSAGIQEFSQLIVYCQGMKLKDLCVNKASDLLAKTISFKEMISLNSVKAAAFCTDMESMIAFNQGHFTRVYPDFSKKSWSSYNFEPHPFWLAGCQMVALNFQMPDRPMHINAGRFAANGGCGFILMPNSIRSSRTKTSPLSLKLRIVAVRHVRTIQAKSIVKIHVKVTIIKKQKSGETLTLTTIINGPCGIWESKHSSKHHDQLHSYLTIKSDDSEVDLIYFEVWTDNQEFCGQAVVPLSCLKTGLRSVQLYDRFNERLDMSALLIDIHPDSATINSRTQVQSSN